MAINNSAEQSATLTGISDRLDTLIELLTANTDNNRFKTVAVSNTPPAPTGPDPTPPDPDPGNSQFSPLDIPGLLLWLKADTGLVNDTSGGNTTISQWLDQSGNNNHATQLSKNSQPVAGNVINNLPTVKFNGSTYLSGNISIPSPGLSLFAVIKRLGSSVQAGGYFSVTANNASDYDGAPNAIVFLQYEGADYIQTYRGGPVGQVPLPAADLASLWCSTFNGSNHELEINNIADLKNSSGNFNASHYALASRFYNSAYDGKVNAEFGEIIIYDSGDSSIKPLIKSYISSKWGI